MPDPAEKTYTIPDAQNPQGDLAEGEPNTPAQGSKVVSSGITPTGGIPVGAATDRVIPDRTIPTSADNAELDYSTRGETMERTLDPEDHD